MNIVFASNNQGKIKELKSILEENQILSLQEAGVTHEVVEDGKTFYENAFKKAKEIFMMTNTPTIADDSGISIHALDDWPGVYTARFLGEKATQEMRNEAMIKALNETKEIDRTASVICYLVYFDGENTIIGKGELHGSIALAPRGENGFGFDSIFELENGKTLAELSIEEKNKISARYLAALDLKEKLNELYQKSKVKIK